MRSHRVAYSTWGPGSEDLYENDGFIVHYFSEEKVNSLLNGFKNIALEKFEEGTFPRKLFFIVNEKK